MLEVLKILPRQQHELRDMPYVILGQCCSKTCRQTKHNQWSGPIKSIPVRQRSVVVFVESPRRLVVYESSSWGRMPGSHQNLFPDYSSLKDPEDDEGEKTQKSIDRGSARKRPKFISETREKAAEGTSWGEGSNKGSEQTYMSIAATRAASEHTEISRPLEAHLGSASTIANMHTAGCNGEGSSARNLQATITITSSLPLNRRTTDGQADLVDLTIHSLISSRPFPFHVHENGNSRTGRLNLYSLYLYIYPLSSR